MRKLTAAIALMAASFTAVPALGANPTDAVTDPTRTRVVRIYDNDRHLTVICLIRFQANPVRVVSVNCKSLAHYPR